MIARVIALIAITTAVVGCATRPEPLTAEAVDRTASSQLNRVTANQTPVTGPIDLYEAMARALKYNLDYQVEVMEHALRAEELELSRVDMLPKLVARAGYSDRDNDYGGVSVLIEDKNNVSLNPSTSIERQHTVSDLTMSWNVLDFGLSYVRAKQRSDDVLMAMEQRRKVANRVIEDVRTAYWRAVGSEKLIRRLEHLDSAVEEALNDSAQLRSRRQTSPIDALTYQRELMSVKLQIKALHRDFSVAKRQLAALMNLTPGTEFEISEPPGTPKLRKLLLDPEELVAHALRNRSELREIDYRMRINARETMAALLEMLPNLNLLAGANWDTNKYLYNDDWINWGAELNWNLLNAFRYPRHKSKIKAQQAMLDQQALATAMAVMTQVHISVARYHLLNDEFDANAQYLDVQQQIDSNVSAGNETGRLSRQRWIRERMNTIVAQLKYDIAYADLQNVYANIYASVGYDAFPAGFDGGESVEELRNGLANLWQGR